MGQLVPLRSGLTETAFMFTASCEIDGEWEEGDIVPYGGAVQVEVSCFNP
jgi:hypothetical protein